MPVRRRISREREDALTALLDDETPAVRNALVDEFRRLGDTGLTLLRFHARSDDRILAAHARRVLDELEGPDPAGEFVRFIRSLNYELESGCTLIHRVVFPQMEAAEIYEQLDLIAARVRELMVHHSSPLEQCKVLNRVLFHEVGFRGNREDFDDPMNSLLGQVLRRRRGIPISLSILYILVARRVGLELEPIGLPGRFMVGCFAGAEPFFIDPFERGALRGAIEIMSLLDENGIEPDPTLLAPAPVGDVLCRCCRNLVRQFGLRNNPGKAKLFASFVREFEDVYRRHAES